VPGFFDLEQIQIVAGPVVVVEVVVVAVAVVAVVVAVVVVVVVVVVVAAAAAAAAVVEHLHHSNWFEKSLPSPVLVVRKKAEASNTGLVRRLQHQMEPNKQEPPACILVVPFDRSPWERDVPRYSEVATPQLVLRPSASSFCPFSQLGLCVSSSVWSIHQTWKTSLGIQGTCKGEVFPLCVF